jgi:uncharacterized membrane protein YhaH (DUF805 family)
LNASQLLVQERPDNTLSRGDSIAGGIVTDVACVLLSALAFVCILTDSDTWVRAPAMLVFVLLVPGWTALRMYGAPASLLVYLGAIGLSIGSMLLLGELLVLYGDWKWFALGLALTGGCAVIGSRTVARGLRTPSSVIDAPARATTPAPGWVPLCSVASVIVGNSVVTWGIRHTRREHFGVLGLVSALSMAYWVGIAIIIGGLLAVCYHGSRWAWLNVAALLVALHGLPGLLEPNPRFSVAWIHTGFIDQIATHGTLLRSLDARFSWAGFFAGGGLLQRWAGTESLLWLVRYAPLFYNALAVVLVALLARRLRATETQSVLAAAFFCCLNWIGQDYFAPQATAFLMYLLIILVVLQVFPADPSLGNRWLVRVLRPAMDVQRGLQGREAGLVLFGVYAMCVAMVISHQLTPGFLVSATLLLVMVNATRLRVLPVFVAVAFIAWLSFGASAYWFGHFDNLTGSVGKVGSIVTQNVGARNASHAVGRRIVIFSRMGLALLAWGLASLSIVKQWFRWSTPVALLCLLAAPFPMLVLQPYGGEMALRVCYFTLPPACILMAQFIVPKVRTDWRRWLFMGIAMLAVVPLFVTARFGNESFEAFSSDDVVFARTLYDVVPDASTVFLASQQTIKYADRVGEVRFRQLPKGTPAEVTGLLVKNLDKTHIYVALTESQEAYGIVTLDRPPDWMQQLRSELESTGQYRVVFEVGGSALLELKP